ncbi:MAG TPA: ATP-binding cassette domain-containing protein [bacterium]
MLQIRDLHYSFGQRALLSGVSWLIQPSKRVALIGPNGAGKTTLFRIMNGEIGDYQGSIIKPKYYRIGYLPQEEFTIGRGSVLDVVMEGQQQVIEIEKQITEIHAALNSTVKDHDDLLKQLGNLTQKFESLQGYQVETNAKSVLSGLGFAETDFSRSLSEFSGGWRMRSYLARLLVQNPDLLLLDEPSNHLDLPSLEWLEQYLLKFDGSMVIVSHDRFFIDRLAQEIFELDRGKLEHYPGNYHFYERKKQEQEELLLKKYEAIQIERERQEKFINRFRYKATKAVQVQSRIKMLEKMEQVELPPQKHKLNFKLSVPAPSYKDVVKIEKLSFQYDHDWVLENVDLNIYRGEKIALVGVNGAGKTTLTKLIAGQISPQLGIAQIGQRTTFGYYAQHQIDTLDLNNTVYDEIASSVSMNYLPRIRDILGVFQIRGDDVFKRIRVLSGGEKARVSLAKILLSPVNFLMMDEPTNHLDMASKEALEEALSEYDGTLLIISHDRYFLDKLVHRVIEVKDHALYQYEGNYSNYLEKRQAQQEAIEMSKAENQPESASKKSKEQKRLEAEARQSVSKDRKRLTKEIEEIERQIEKLENRKAEIELLMAKPETYQNSNLAASLPYEYARVKDDLQKCYEHWETAHVALDELLQKLI